MKTETGARFLGRKGRRWAATGNDALLETMVAALPMDGDRQQAERSWQWFMENENGNRLHHEEG